MSTLPAPDMTITVTRSLHPFRHSEEDARQLFADHPHAENFLSPNHSDEHPDLADLEALGPHPLLNRQTKACQPLRWINIRIQAAGTNHWIMPFLRDDNLYVRGFGNRHNAHELSQKLCLPGKEKLEVLSQQLPLELNCILVNWDVTYPKMFGLKDKHDLEAEFQRIMSDEDFVFEAVCFLSSYVHVEGSEAEQKAMKYLAGITFMLCEFYRMNLRLINVPLRLWIHTWGDVCLEYLKWRDRNFTDWILDTVRQKMRGQAVVTKMQERFKELGIQGPADGLQVLGLIINRDVTYYANLEKNRSKKNVKVSDGGGKFNSRLTQKGGGASNMPQEGNTSHETKAASNSNQKGAVYGGNQIQYSQRDLVEEFVGLMSHDTAKDSLPWGRRRVQILRVSANFEVDWMDFHDWHRPQAIHRRKINDPARTGPISDPPVIGAMTDIALIGPARPIGAYTALGLEFSPARTTNGGEGRRRNQRTINERGAIVESWQVDSYDDEPSFHRKDIAGEWEGQKIQISYMIVPDTVEARIKVKLLLTGGSRYHVTGFVKAWDDNMGPEFVRLLSDSDQTVEVPSNQWTLLPLMLSLLCLSNAEEVQLKVAAYLTIRSCSNSEEQALNVSHDHCFKLSQGAARQEREVRGNRISVAVKFST
ncbi:uncharacterized protein LOC125519704 [Triticum urartu]|uniref:uncharacterized protein LOC125519704 n=1 Tax=Triticum urartu TaxID=4572 RepID=UPI002042F726|nr:uncharacterized protein LOC125519704 [Triticum urartu]